MVLVCFMLLRSSMTTNWGIIQGYCGSWPDTPPWSHQGSTPGPWGARDEPLTCTQKMESRSTVWRALQGKQGGGLPVPPTERPAAGGRRSCLPISTTCLCPPPSFLSPFLSPAQPPNCSSLVTPRGGSREQPTRLKAGNPGSEPRPHRAPCLAPQVDSPRPSCSTRLSPQPPHSGPPTSHAPLAVGQVSAS